MRDATIDEIKRDILLRTSDYSTAEFAEMMEELAQWASDKAALAEYNNSMFDNEDPEDIEDITKFI